MNCGILYSQLGDHTIKTKITFSSEEKINEHLTDRVITEVLFLRDDDSDKEDKSTPSGVNLCITMEDGSRLFIESTDAIITLEKEKE